MEKHSSIVLADNQSQQNFRKNWVEKSRKHFQYISIRMIRQLLKLNGSQQKKKTQRECIHIKLTRTNRCQNLNRMEAIESGFDDFIKFQ